MNIALWTVQVLLAVMFAMAGVMKSTQPKAVLAEKFPWSQDLGVAAVRVVGVSELLAALGLVLPAAFGFATVLTPLAALGLVVVMVLAALLHLRRKEYGAIVFNLVLLALAAFVAWGRFGPHAF